MIRIFDGVPKSRREIFPNETGTSSDIESAVASILEDVRKRGDEAVLDYTEKFDRVRPDPIQVSREEIDAAFDASDPSWLATLGMAADNIRAFHERQRRDGFEIKGGDGIILGQRVLPLQTVGIYIPGGSACYPSSVLMNAIPAKIAGVKRIVMVTPPGKDGKIQPAILAAARIAGVTDIYKIGGAQAVAALAYGTATVPKVDKIVGPGNIFVATAKKMVFGIVDIDMIAGPSEILILADGGADPAVLAADMLGQAEHDRLASAVLICTDIETGKAVSAELERQIPLLPRRDIARASIDDNGCIIVSPSIEEGIKIANEIAPEHFELCVDEPFKYLDSIKNAGSVFLGNNSPEALGDYWAGPNHTLPTLGTARFSSPLSVDEFVKRSSYIYYTKEALGKVKDQIIDLAGREELSAHAKSVEIRFEGE